ncbi:MAG: protease modulator HflC [Elusimicrobiota bacterium]
MSGRGLPILIAVALGLFFFRASAYRVSEWEQSIITQFGRTVGEPVTQAGLHFKMPFIQKIHRLDKRILNWDGYPNQIPTKDKKYIWVDTTARWRIVDPLLFIQTVRDEDGARSRLDGILDSVTRDVFSNNNLVEAVRNSNAILDVVRAQQIRSDKGELSDEQEEVVGEIEPILVGREQLSARIIEKARAGLKEFGIEIIDVQLRRIVYEKSVENKVFERMVSERQRIAERIRSVGKGEQAKIEGKIKKDLQVIESEAYRTARKIRGKAEAIGIYAGAMNADPDFYEFVRTLEAYEKALPEDTKLILSTDNKFLELLRTK